MSQWFSRDFLQRISEQSEALCFALRLQLSLPLEGSGGVRVGEMSEFSKPFQGIAHATGFFMALNDFSFLTLGLFTYTQCCADKPVWEVGERHSICGFCGVYVPQWPISSYQVDVTKQSWEKRCTIGFRNQKLQHYLSIAYSHGTAKMCSYVTHSISNDSNEQTKMFLYSQWL